MDAGRPEHTAAPPDQSPSLRLRPGVRTALVLAVGVAGGLLGADAVRWLIGRLRPLLIVVLVSLFLSFAMEPAVQYLARRGIRRGFGTVLVFAVVAVVGAGFLAAMAPLVIDQIRNLIEQGPNLLADLSRRARDLPGIGGSLSSWLSDAQTDLPRRLPDLAGRIGGGLLGLGTTVLGGVLQALTALLVTFYLVADGPKVRRALVRRLDPEDQREVLALWELAIAKTGGYVYSRAVTAVVSAAVHAVAFTIIGVPYSAALGVWVGVVSSVIPVVGTYLAGLLPLLVALAAQPFDAVWVLAVIVLYQQLENYLVAPRITARTMELHPAVAFLAVLAGGALLGAVGALLALPAAAIATALAGSWGARHELVEHELVADTPPRTRTPDRGAVVAEGPPR